MWPVRTTYTRPSTSPKDSHQNKLDICAHQRILPTPESVPLHRLSKRKVRLTSASPTNSRQLAHHQSGNRSDCLTRESNHTESVSARKYSSISISHRISTGIPFSVTKCAIRTVSGRTNNLLTYICYSKPRNSDVLCCLCHLHLWNLSMEGKCTCRPVQPSVTSSGSKSILRYRQLHFSFCEREKHLAHFLYVGTYSSPKTLAL